MPRTAKVKGGGFTLVELLVVIAIISILLTILTPALQKARLQAKAALCLSNVKQWGQVTFYYAQDNDNRLYQSVAGGELSAREAYWMGASLPYYQDPAIRYCPACHPDPDNDATSYTWDDYGETYEHWGPIAAVTAGYWWDEFPEGSYGINEWCACPLGEEYWGFPTALAWRKIDVRGADNIPLFADCLFVDGYPLHNDQPPTYPDEHNGWGTNGMKMFCINRHQGGINMVFLDLSARKVGLKELWKLKWHREFPISNQWTQPDAPWPAWMAGL